MSDLLQNELLSAYLDGELTAAEQARVERLLAGNPAARRFVAQMRSLSTELQKLPRQTVGEDLSAAVLRIAERRMLTEGLSGGAAPSPAPVASAARAGAFFRRFLVPRAMVWTGIAVAVAVMISFTERREDRPAADKELARATAPRDADEMASKQRSAGRKTTRVPGPPPTMQAAPDEVASNEKDATVADRREEAIAEEKQDVLSEKKSDRMKFSAAAEPPSPKAIAPAAAAEALAAKVAPLRKDSQLDRAEGAGGSFAAPAKAEATADGANKSLGRLNRVGMADAPAKGSAGKSVAPAESAAPPRMAASKLAASPPAGAARAMVKAADKPAREPAKEKTSAFTVQAVFCNISADAAKKKSFDKLLDANGVESVRLRGSVVAAAARGLADDLKGAELIFIEATHAQTKAVMAGLVAQPRLFLSVSVKPPHDEAARRVVRLYYERRDPHALDKKPSALAPLQKTLFVVRVGPSKGK